MTDEESSNHRLPPEEDEEAPLRVPRWFFYVAIAALVGGGGGSGLTAILHNAQGGSVEVTLTRIEGDLKEINRKLDDEKDSLKDHETRLRRLEERLKLP